MKNADAVTALAALAQENRLDVFRLLVQAGPEGMPAGKVAKRSNSPPILSLSISTVCARQGWSPCGARAGR